MGRGLKDGHHLVLRDRCQRVLFLVFGLRVFLSGERNCSVTRSGVEVPLCVLRLPGLPPQTASLASSHSQEKHTGQSLTMQATLEHLFLTKKWVKDAAHNRGQRVLLCHTLRRGGQICHRW